MAQENAIDMGLVVDNYKILSSLLKADLEKEYNEKRIKGTEYADVYNNLMDKVLNLAMASPESAANIGLIQAKTVDTIADTKIKTDHSAIDLQTKQQQLILLNEQIEQVKCEVEKCNAQTALIEAQEADQKYVTQYIRPEELSTAKFKAQLTEAQKEDQVYVTNYIRPAEQSLTSNKAGLTAAQQQDQEYVTQSIRPEELDLKQQQVLLEQERVNVQKKEVMLKDEQINLTKKQIEGFCLNAYGKALDAATNALGMAFAAGVATDLPSWVGEAGTVFNSLKNCVISNTTVVAEVVDEDE